MPVAHRWGAADIGTGFGEGIGAGVSIVARHLRYSAAACFTLPIGMYTAQQGRRERRLGCKENVWGPSHGAVYAARV